MALTVLCDTSVLVAGIVKEHTHHTKTLPLIEQVVQSKLKVAVSAHSLAECFSTLTKLKEVPPMPPSQALTVIEKNILLFDLVALTVADYQQAMKLVVESELRGGAIYDALILQTARKKQIKILLTWNEKDFVRFAQSEVKIQTPASFA